MRLYLNFSLFCAILKKSIFCNEYEYVKNNMFNTTAKYSKMIRNSAKRTVIMKNSVFADDNLSKFIGLMFSKQQKNALIFKFKEEKIISLHMLFVFYHIDVLFLGKNKTVVDKKENLMPFAFYKSKKKAMYAVEIPNGTIKKTKTEIGDKIIF